MSVISSTLVGNYRLELWSCTNGKYKCDVLPRGSNIPIHTTAQKASQSLAKRTAREWLMKNREPYMRWQA